MRRVELLSQHTENFMGVKDRTIKFDKNHTIISGQNATGKTATQQMHFWLLFGENADGNTKFGIRPVDQNGEKIHNVVIKVEEQFQITNDGSFTPEIHTITKTQTENWVKKRGSDVATLQGNVNSYEIDGYPKSESDFNKWIEQNICYEDTGKVLSSPEYFPSMPWKDQREILFNAVSLMSDYEMAHEDGGFADIENELKVAGSADVVRQKYAKSLKELKKQQEELPVRIDEISKQKKEVDKSELESVAGRFNELAAKMKPLNEKSVELHRSTDGLMNIQFDLNDLQRQLEEKKNAVANQLRDAIANEQRLIKDKEQEKQFNASHRNDLQNDSKAVQVTLNVNQKAYDECMAKKITVNDLCPYCGQHLPKMQHDKALQVAEADHNEELTEWQKNIRQCTDHLEQNAKEIKAINNLEAKLDKDISDSQKKIEELQKQLDGATPVSDPELEKKIAEKSSEVETGKVNLARLQTIDAEVRKLESERDTLDDRLKELQGIVKNNSEIESRIKELHEEQLDVAQKAADCEKMLDLLDRFTKRKSDIISNEINSKFSLASFKLFETQINGGTKDTCELQFKGVDYSDLNFGSRLRVGIDLINGLSRIFGISLPVFLDFAESVNEKNVPEIDGQLIELRVTDEEALTVH